jgi:H+/Cl- antiporter ClcA/CBS domain-containing protein
MTTTLPESSLLLPKKTNLISLSDRLSILLDRLQPSPEVLILIFAVLIGNGAGVAMVIFHYLIDLFQNLSFNYFMGFISVWGGWTLVFVPMLGGLVVGLMRWRYSEFLGQGFSALLSKTREQKISPLRPLIKMLAAAISLGTGASLGPEAPSMEIGSNLGAIVAQIFKVSQERYRLLLGAGAAAGFAAGFNAPIAGVFFALEVVLGTTFTTPAASFILLSAVISSTVSRICLGVHPAFDIPVYQVLSNWEIVFYLGLGLLASLVSLIYTQTIKFVQACFRGEIKRVSWLGKIPIGIQPLVGGTCLGLVALQFPQVLGVSYGTLELILEGNPFSINFLSVLLVVKLIVTAISLGSGLVGGIFAPAMFLGACLGAIYANVLNAIVPPGLIEIAPSPAYAMVGMAAVLASSVRAPLTAILLLFEITQNYLVILPLMAAVGVSLWVIDQVKSKQAVEGLKLPQMGINLEQTNELEVLQQVAIASFMQKSYLALPSSTLLSEALTIMFAKNSYTALVLNEGELLIGVVTLTDIKRAIVRVEAESFPIPWHTQKLEEICTAEIIYAYPDEPLSAAWERMKTRGLFLLPVVDRDNPQKVEGVIPREQITLASNVVSVKEALRPYLNQLEESSTPQPPLAL